MKFLDGFMNLVSNLGVAGRDKSAANTYQTTAADVIQLEEMYRSSWSARRVLDIPAGDMTRAWRVWKNDHTEMQKAERELDVKNLSKNALIAAHKLGGSAIYIGTDDADLSEPLDVTQIKQGGIKYLTLFDRLDLATDKYDEDPLSPRFRRGRTYRLERSGNGATGQNITLPEIHHTRFAWFPGRAVSPRTWELQEGWDDSYLTGLSPLIEAADTALADLKALLHEAKLDIIKIKNLPQYFENADYEARLLKRLTTSQYMKSTINTLVLDSEEDFETKVQAFTGVTDAAKFAVEVLSGAADIPTTRFLGQSPGGLNSSGDGELKNYYDGIKASQENELASSLYHLDRALSFHALGKDLPDENAYTWRSLMQHTDKEKSEMAKQKADTSKVYYDMGIFDDELFAQMIVGQLEEDETYPNIGEVSEGDFDGSENIISIKEPEEETQPGQAPGPGNNTNNNPPANS